MINNNDNSIAKEIANRLSQIENRSLQNSEIARLPFDMRLLVERYLQVLFHRKEIREKHES